MNVRLAPGQAGSEPEVSAMLTTGVTCGVMLMVIAFEVAVVGFAHDSLDVKTQVTACPFVIIFVVKVAALPG